MTDRRQVSNPKNSCARFASARTNGKSSASCLPPIATFSQRCPDLLKSVESSSQPNRLVQRRCAHRKEFYCTWSSCPRALSRIPFSHKCRLNCHMRLHLNNESYPCSHCNQSFKTPLNLRRHRTVHQNTKQYKCQVCSRQFYRSSEWSRCLKHHRHAEELTKTEHLETGTSSKLALSSNSSTPAVSLSSTGYTSSSKGLKDDSIRCKPYKCPVCPKTRAYTDPGSLRKHIRLYHPDYKALKMQTDVRTSISTTREPDKTAAERTETESTSGMNSVQPLLIPVVTTDKVNSMTTSDLSVITVPGYSADQLIVGPVWICSSSDKFNPDEPNRTTTVSNSVSDSHTSVLSLPPTERVLCEPIDNHTSAQFQSSVETESIQLNSMDAQYQNGREKQQDLDQDDDDTEQCNGPVDLCNSTVWLQTIMNRITDLPMGILSSDKSTIPTSQMESDSAEMVTLWGESSLIDQSAALDLTEPPSYITLHDKVIDLSGDTTFALTSLNPIDLSAPQPQKKDNTERTSAMPAPSTGSNTILPPSSSVFRPNQPLTNWDLEPGFSFTDLLTNNELDDPDTIFNYLLSNDLSAHPSPCKSSVPITHCSVTDTVTISTQPPPLDLRLPHASLFSW